MTTPNETLRATVERVVREVARTPAATNADLVDALVAALAEREGVKAPTGRKALDVIGKLGSDGNGMPICVDRAHRLGNESGECPTCNRPVPNGGS